MARPRRGKRRSKSVDWLTDYLVTGIEPEEHPDVNPYEYLITSSPKELRQAWQERREAIMAKWDKPGCRPWAWWEFEAPGLRRYLAGPGVAVSERYPAVRSSGYFGIPNWLGDVNDPPEFETQYDYLKRHGLLLEGEDEPIPEPVTRGVLFNV